jgi:hypothetical protein
MDTPLHTLALPDADPATLKRPETAARELIDAVCVALAGRFRGQPSRDDASTNVCIEGVAAPG